MCASFLNFFKSFNNMEDGVTAIEYGLIAALITVVIITALFAVGEQVESTFNIWTTAVHNAVGS